MHKNSPPHKQIEIKLQKISDEFLRYDFLNRGATSNSGSCCCTHSSSFANPSQTQSTTTWFENLLNRIFVIFAAELHFDSNVPHRLRLHFGALSCRIFRSRHRRNRFYVEGVLGFSTSGLSVQERTRGSSSLLRWPGSRAAKGHIILEHH